MTKLYVGNLSFGMNDESLQQLFVDKGYQVSSARVITDRKQDAHGALVLSNWVMAAMRRRRLAN